MRLRICRSAAQNILHHALLNRPSPVCGLLAGVKNKIDTTVVLPCPGPDDERKAWLAGLRAALGESRRMGLTLMGLYISSGIPIDVLSFKELLGRPEANDLWLLAVDLDTDGRMDLRAYRGLSEHGEGVPLEMCESEALSQAGACG